MTCDTCHAELQIGDFPFCPHGATRLAVHADDIPGGMMVENGFAEPIKVYSHSEHRRRLAAEGCEIRAMNRGPNDKICRPWHTVDLAAAKALLERGPQAIREKHQRWAQASIKITVTDAGTLRQKVAHD